MPDNPIVPINLTAEDVANAAHNRNGLTYKGFGVLSGNATSAMLLDYRREQPDVYWAMIRTLFGGSHPIMNVVKIEMGNDRNNSTGPNACTMRSRDEYPMVEREPGFQLAADAATVNPNLHVSILRWCAPTWVRDNDDIYRWYKNTILAAWRRCGVMVDSVNPDVNERTADLDWIADFAHRVRTDETGFEVSDAAAVSAADAQEIAAEGARLASAADAGWSSDEERERFHRIAVITSDEEVTGTFGDEVIATPAYLDAMDVAAYHYSVVDDANGNFKRLADEFDKEVWNSEAQAVFSNSADRPNNTNPAGLDDVPDGTGIGGPGSPLEMANTLIKGFVESRRTLAIYQPALGACHEHMEYASKELVSMRDPWSGWMYYDAGCAILEHFAKFARLGWDDGTRAIWRAIPQASGCKVGGNNPVNGARHGEPSYLTLASPDGADCSIVIVNDSSLNKTYTLTLDPALGAAGKPLHIWQTRAAEPGQPYDANYRRHISAVEAQSAVYTLDVAPWSIITATTLAEADVEPYAIARTGEASRAVLDEDPAAGVLHADDFCAGNGPIPRYTTDSNGAFERVSDPERGTVLRQQIDHAHAGHTWIEGDPRTAIGDSRWANYRVSVDVLFEHYDGCAPYVLVGARELGGHKLTSDLAGYSIKLFSDGLYLLRRYDAEVRRGHMQDLVYAARRAGKPELTFKPGVGQWNTVTLEVAGDMVTFLVNGIAITSWTDEAPQSAGRVQLGSSFDHVRFDNLRIERVAGFSPYLTNLIDDMHMTSWSDGQSGAAVPDVVEYGGTWEHLNGQGMFTYMRSISRTHEIGSSLTCRFTGTGLDVFGPSDGGVLVDVLVDGRLVEASKPLQANQGSLRTQLRVENLAAGDHTVTLRLASQHEWSVDAIGVLA
ncbi:family 16 glycoside hydrolase [Bifidobacterium oedipodis]|uniref:family 16 glycoside hydrolase n=1 Tax=Bifidobacterium oedipodis TaxID=2675322 RepID=UPI00145E1062